jgi:hypothetical protein
LYALAYSHSLHFFIFALLVLRDRRKALATEDALFFVCVYRARAAAVHALYTWDAVITVPPLARVVYFPNVVALAAIEVVPPFREV